MPQPLYCGITVNPASKLEGKTLEHRIYPVFVLQALFRTSNQHPNAPT